MGGNLLPVLAVIVGVALLILIAGRAGKKAGVRRNGRMRDIAGRLGLDYSEDPPPFKFLPPDPVVAGTYSGRQAKIYSFSRGSGRNRTHWVATRLLCPGAGSLELTIRTQHAALFEKIAGAFGYKDIVIGDPVFDSRLVINGNDEDYIKAALIPEVRTRILEFWPRASGSKIIVRAGEVVFEEQGSFYREKSLAHLEKACPVLSDLAAIAEVHGP